jgi:YGGT family
MSSHQEGKASIDDDVNVRIRRESARVALKESAELGGVAHELKQKSVREAAETERELGRGRTAPRISQAVDYLFYIIYGLIGLQFVLKLMGARPGNGFVQFVAGVSWPLLAPFERIVEPPSAGAFQNDAWMKGRLEIWPGQKCRDERAPLPCVLRSITGCAAGERLSL